MAITDAKPGFRLPWSAERGDAPTAPGSEAPPTTDAPVDPAPGNEVQTPVMRDAPPSSTESVAPSAPTPARKPNKLMADLTRAMQAAAEEARAEALARLGADAKTFIETIHATSATDATDLRRHADDDVAAVREWSKAEIARIREETEGRIGQRKATLEHEIEAHTAAVERRIGRVQARVAAFETEMADFFERLTAEDDPTRLAAMAENLPEPPSFDAEMDGDDVAPDVSLAAADGAATGQDEASATAEAHDPAAPVATDALMPADGGTPENESAAGDEPAWPSEVLITPATDEPVVPADADLFSIGDDEPSDDPAGQADDQRATGFDAAEAEAASFGDLDAAGDDTSGDVPEDAVAARLAGLVSDADSTATVTTRAVVVGLVSVASIAGFKRHLARVHGVAAVGVTSSPDGEFVFAVTHTASLDLQGAITTLPGFAARITRSTDDELHVTARDPETES